MLFGEVSTLGPCPYPFTFEGADLEAFESGNLTALNPVACSQKYAQFFNPWLSSVQGAWGALLIFFVIPLLVARLRRMRGFARRIRKDWTALLQTRVLLCALAVAVGLVVLLVDPLGLHDVLPIYATAFVEALVCTGCVMINVFVVDFWVFAAKSAEEQQQEGTGQQGWPVGVLPLITLGIALVYVGGFVTAMARPADYFYYEGLMWLAGAGMVVMVMALGTLYVRRIRAHLHNNGSEDARKAGADVELTHRFIKRLNYKFHRFIAFLVVIAIAQTTVGVVHVTREPSLWAYDVREPSPVYIAIARLGTYLLLLLGVLLTFRAPKAVVPVVAHTNSRPRSFNPGAMSHNGKGSRRSGDGFGDGNSTSRNTSDLFEVRKSRLDFDSEAGQGQGQGLANEADIFKSAPPPPAPVVTASTLVAATRIGSGSGSGSDLGSGAAGAHVVRSDSSPMPAPMRRGASGGSFVSRIMGSRIGSLITLSKASSAPALDGDGDGDGDGASETSGGDGRQGTGRLGTGGGRGSFLARMMPGFLGHTKRKPAVSVYDLDDADWEDAQDPLLDLLNSETYRADFKKFLLRHHCGENILCWESIVQFEDSCQLEGTFHADSQAVAHGIVDEFVAEDAPNPINVSAGNLDALRSKRASGATFEPDSFRRIKKECFSNMKGRYTEFLS